ncbi:MAG: hypothetical protein ACOYPR_18085 [Saprospiraceae bacterium]
MIKFSSKLPIAFLFMCIAAVPNAWSQISVSAQLGYAFPWAENDVPEGSLVVKSNTVRETELYKKSYGAGQHYMVSLSHPIFSNVSLGLQLSYLSGAKTSRTFDYITNNGAEINSGRMFWLTPQIQMEKPFRHLTLYAGIGPSIGFSGKIIKDLNNVSQTDQLEKRTIYSKGLAYGVSSNVGATCFISKNKRMKLLAEIRLTSASFAPKRSDLVRWNQNGTDFLATTSVSNRVIVYKKKRIKDATVTQDPNQPGVATLRYYAFSSVGINIGIVYLLFAGKE